MGCGKSALNKNKNNNNMNSYKICNLSRKLFKIKNFKNILKNCVITKNGLKRNNNSTIELNYNINNCISINYDNNNDDVLNSTNLNMEIKMINNLTKIMLNTSSPLFEDRSIILNDSDYKMNKFFKEFYQEDNNDDDEDEEENENNLSYTDWRNELKLLKYQNYVLRDITRVPEAVSDFKLDHSPGNDRKILRSTNSQEWGSGWTGPEFIVEIQETATTDLKQDNIINKYNSTNLQNEGPKIIVRTEEICIVLFVLLLWIGAIALFFNRWGKIRMLEPYQPKFQQQHRSSCPLVDIDSVQTHPRTSISRMSMGMAIPIQMPHCQFSSFHSNIGSFPHTRGYTTFSRPRQNSVFVGPPIPIAPKPPRKTRSAIDIHSLVLDENAEQV